MRSKQNQKLQTKNNLRKQCHVYGIQLLPFLFEQQLFSSKTPLCCYAGVRFPPERTNRINNFLQNRCETRVYQSINSERLQKLVQSFNTI